MNDLLTKLLDLDTLSLRDGLEFSFERPLETWAWALVVAIAFGVSYWSYRQLTGSRTVRAALCVIRAALLVALVALIAGPRLVERTERTERDWVLFLVDRSESLQIEDAPPAAAAAQRRSRDAQARAAIREHWSSIRDLAEAREVVFLGFDAGAYDLAVERDPAAPAQPSQNGDAAPESRGPLASIDLGPAQGRRTALGASLEQALRRAAARPLSGVVILSDGRSLDEPSRAAVRQLQADRVPVLALPLGDPSSAGDLAIRSVQGPGVAFTGDLAPVTVRIERVGGDEDAPPTPATVRLV
ncbi:MAG: hypothetical protein ACTS27_12360, partial [Phycisphaerales bacterium]